MLALSSMRTIASILFRSLLLGGAFAVAGCEEPPSNDSPEIEQAPLPTLAKSFEGNFSPTALDIGPDGDFLLGGTFSGTIDFGAGPHEHDGPFTKIFVAHLDADGEHLFSGSTGSNDQLNAVALGPLGNVLMAGYVDGNINFGKGPLSANGDGFIAEFAPNGQPDFSSIRGGAASDKFFDIAITKSENVVLAGYFGNDADLGAGAAPAYSASEQVVVAYDKDRNNLWELRYSNSSYDEITALATDKDGNIYVVSSSYGPYILGDFSIPPGAHIMKLSPAGDVLWTQSVNTQVTGFPSALDVVVDENSNAFFVGVYAGGPIEFGEFTAPYTDYYQPYVAGVSKDGAPLFLRSIATEWNNQFRPRLTARKGGGIVIGLTTYGQVDYGNGFFGTKESLNVVLASIDETGKLIETAELDGNGNETLGALGTTRDGVPVVIGTFNNLLDVGEDRLIAKGTSDLFVVRHPIFGDK